MDDGAGRGGQERHGSWQERETALARGPEGALRLEAPLQLLQPGTELADVVELDLVDHKADGPVLRPEIDAPSEDERLAVLR